MEIRDLYDENKQITGETIIKGEKIPKGRYILVVVIWIQNSKGELLLQQRSFTKKSYPGKWATTGGHPKTGETSIEGMITEVNEEIGVELKEEEIKFLKTFMDDNNTFIDVYYIKKDLDVTNMVLQKEEVNQVKWVSIQEFEEMMEKGLVASSHVKLYELSKDFLN